MTIGEMVKRLERMKLPTAYFTFSGTKKNPAPALPYIVWFRREHKRGADFVNNISENEIFIELYTALPDAELEEKMERLVLSGVEYDKEQEWIESESMIQTAYSFSNIEKRRKRNA